MEAKMAKVYTEHDRRVPQTPEEAFPSPGFLPVSAIMVSVADPDSGVPNIIPLTGWGFLNRLPLMIGIAVCIEEYNIDYYVRGSHALLRKTMDFVVNVPTQENENHIEKTGELSRSKDPTVNKFKECGLTIGEPKNIKSPHIVECPINFECVVRSIVNMGSHDLFLGEVVGCFTDGEIVDTDIRYGYNGITMSCDDGTQEILKWTTLIEKVVEK